MVISRKYKNLSDTILQQAQLLGIRRNLASMQAVLTYLGNPQDQFNTIHVAGTNGKGSVCAMIESILHAAGFLTGMYTSPHLVKENERIRFRTGDISEHDLNEAVAEVYYACQKIHTDLTYFEYLTAAAFLYFSCKHIDCACIETGMGGRWDATNTIASPLVAVLTSISQEHEQYLGDTVHDIVKEKAAIIKNDSVVISAPFIEKHSERYVMRVCAENKAPLFLYGRDFSAVPERFDRKNFYQMFQYHDQSGHEYTYRLNLTGPHQVINAALAIAAVDALKRVHGFSFSYDAVIDGLGRVVWPGRFERVHWVRGRERVTLFLDGAHNPGAIKALTETMQQMDFSKAVFVFAVLKDKDYRSMINMLLPWAKKIYTVSLQHTRALSSRQMVRTMTAKGFTFVEQVHSWDDLFSRLLQEETMPIIMTGSLYLLGLFLADCNRQVKRKKKTAPVAM